MMKIPSIIEKVETKETWKDIKGYKNKYKISNMGNIKALSRKQNLKNRFGKIIKLNFPEKILSKCLDSDGYEVIGLAKKGKNTTRKIHRLVAETFLTNKNNYSQINHKDFNRKNNNVENLEWCSLKQNIEYTRSHNRNAFGINHYRHKLNNNQIVLIRSLSKQIEQKRLAEIYHVKASNISAIIRRITWKQV